MAFTGKGEGAATTTAGMTLSTLKSICQYHGWHDNSTAGVAALVRFINRTMFLLSDLAPWPEYHKRDGTITLVAADEDYALSQNNIKSVGNIIRDDRVTPLDIISMVDWVKKTKTQARAGMPTEYALRKYVSSGNVKIEVLVYPKPGTAEADEVLYYTYRMLPAELSSDSDVIDWPDYRLWLLEEALEVRIASGKRDSSGVALESPEFMAQVQRAMTESRTTYMPIPLQVDASLRHTSLGEVLPTITS